MHADGKCLYLEVKGSGKKYWIYKCQMNKRRRNMVLGPCSVVSLVNARDLAHEAYRQRRSGIDPEAYRSLDSYHWLVREGPPPPEGSYYAVKMSEWYENPKHALH